MENFKNNIFDDRRQTRSMPNFKVQNDQTLIVRGKNECNPANVLYLPPDYGNRFKKQNSLLKKLDCPVERDIREYFLSDVERKLMLATLNFATNYVQGYINTKDMRLASKWPGEMIKVKSTAESVTETHCTMCKYKFKENTRVWLLYVIVRPNKPAKDPNKFNFCCNLCYSDTQDVINSYEIYPKFHLTDLHCLLREGFFHQYIFPLFCNRGKLYEKKYEIEKHYANVFELIQSLLLQYKKPEESVLKIELSTSTGSILNEHYSIVRVQRYRRMLCDVADVVNNIDDVDCFIIDGTSEMMKLIKSNKSFCDVKDVVTATLLIRPYEFQQQIGGVFTFPVKTIKSNYCVLCKRTKMYYKHPVLYCTKCGFTSKYRFYKYSQLKYYPEIVKTYEMGNEMILFYDLDEYKKIKL
ncbi:me53 [Oxyplax ochracea nucleopolyhedrovirus]|uniref:Me53 n=1 Tax=Oxyplax ochracea nucleopolyhedrovirus TaxID=2083176 RepID=A0A2L0WTZ3_9ABAC|nr:me53 [Oxyplax ochracea nucleopolyhedrovirus]AVA31115.1 me53 [Oxyplax ochracea nucleopolyhedrovirus]